MYGRYRHCFYRVHSGSHQDWMTVDPLQAFDAAFPRNDGSELHRTFWGGGAIKNVANCCAGNISMTTAATPPSRQ